LKSRLHSVRKLCNKNVHATELSSESSNEDNIKNLKATYTAQLREDAILARELTVRNMEDIFPILTKSKTNISVIMTDIPDNSWSKTLIDAATTSCARTQLQAGKIYEAQANEMRKKDPFNFEHDFCYRYNGLKKLAATYYEMSFKISADVGTNETEVNNENYSPVQIFKEHSNPEALYLYWSVIQEMGSFDGEWITEYQWMLETSAKLGHPEAQAVFACRLLEKGEFDSALSMLEHAITFEIDAAYLGIATYYSDKRTGKRDIKKAIGYLNKGAEINGPECLCKLGELYYTGTWVEKSESKGTEYILQAIQFGSTAAEDYYFKAILRVREKFENDISKNLNNIIKLFNGRNQTITNIGRNDPCHCGSGKKHKKCCLNKKHT
jgi:TPR repeat protein